MEQVVVAFIDFHSYFSLFILHLRLLPSGFHLSSFLLCFFAFTYTEAAILGLISRLTNLAALSCKFIFQSFGYVKHL